MARTPRPAGITIERDLALDIRDFTAQVAMAALQEEVRKGFDREPLVVTDGVPRRAPEEVRPFGKIEWISKSDVRDIAEWVFFRVVELSPVLTGAYMESHVRMLNGETVRDFSKYRDGDRIQIAATVPYARKLEGRPARTKVTRAGRERVAGVRGLSKQAPRGIYRVVAKEAVQRFGRQAFIDFKYVKLNLGVKVKALQGGGTNRKRVMKDMIYPVIQIYRKPE